MAEDGIEDHGLAKKKAARQAGVADTHPLPGNDEIDDALKLYRDIYQADDHRAQVAELREIAVCAMVELEAFNPYLTGAVLSGIAGKYAGIQLQLFTDDVKAVELFLLEHGIDYQAGQTSLYSGDTRITVPLFTLNNDGAEIEIAVLSPRDARGTLKTSLVGKTIERAKLAMVEELLSQSENWVCGILLLWGFPFCRNRDTTRLPLATPPHPQQNKSVSHPPPRAETRAALPSRSAVHRASRFARRPSASRIRR